MNEQSEDYLILNGQKVSPETLESVAEPVVKKKRNLWWLTLMMRHPILAYVLIVGGTGAVLSHFWKSLDKHLPRLNEFIHSNVSDQNDVDYQLYKLNESKKAYNSGLAICDEPKASFASCRSAILGSEPALIDMGARVGKLSGAWQKEVTQKSMPDVCKHSGSRLYAAFNEYVIQEQRVMTLFKEVDPNSKKSIAAMNKELQSVVPAEDATVKELSSLSSWPKECAGY
jgi:hypothetical protein